MTEFRIIQAELAHLAILTDLFDAYRVFYQQPSSPDECRSFLRQRMQNNESIIYLALDPQGRGLGFTQLYPTWASVALAPAWVLYDLYVVPLARRQGVGRALMEKAVELGWQTGAKLLTLETAVDNKPAQALYESQGWQRETEFYSYYLDLG